MFSLYGWYFAKYISSGPLTARMSQDPVIWRTERPSSFDDCQFHQIYTHGVQVMVDPRILKVKIDSPWFSHMIQQSKGPFGRWTWLKTTDNSQFINRWVDCNNKHEQAWVNHEWSLPELPVSEGGLLFIRICPSKGSQLLTTGDVGVDHHVTLTLCVQVSWTPLALPNEKADVTIEYRLRWRRRCKKGWVQW